MDDSPARLARPYSRSPFLERRLGEIGRREEQRRDKLNEHAAYEARENFIAMVEKAAGRHPEIDKKVFVDILKAYDEEYAEYKRLVDEIRSNAPTRTNAENQIRQMNANLVGNVMQRVQHHGQAAVDAMKAIREEKQPESFFTPVIRQVYNSDRGGVQFGGVAGAVVMGGLGYYLAGSSGASGLLKWGLTLGATALGAVIGNQVLPSEPSFKPANLRGELKKPDLRSPSLQPEIHPMSATIVKGVPETDPEKLKAALGGHAIPGHGATPTTLTGSESRGFTPSPGGGSAPGTKDLSV